MNITKRLLALLLATVMLFSASPLAFATGLEEEEPAVVVEETEETAEVVEEVPAEEAEEAPAAVVSSAALPYGLKGMPAGFSLSKKDLALKNKMLKNDVPAVIASLTEGKDYVTGQVYFLADSQEYAETVAAAFNAKLVRFVYGVGVLELSDLSVAEAVALAADPTVALPPVNANLLRTIDPDVVDTAEKLDNAAFALMAPQAGDWEYWVRNMSDPDPLLMFTSDYLYQWHHDAIHTYKAWSYTTGDPRIKVAVIDTGVSSHTGEFDGRLTQIDVGFGLEPIMNNDNAHGTFVASCIAAAMDNGIGGAGVAPDVSIVGYRIANEYGGLDGAAILSSVLSSIEEGVDIVNMSFGGPIYDPIEEYVFQKAYDAGITLVASAGNEDSNNLAYPSCYSTTISVAATNRANDKSAFSTYGVNVDIAAPGTNISGVIQDGSNYMMSGTSFSSPITAGVAALYMSKYGHTAPAVMKEVLCSSVTKISDKSIGAGVVDASKLFPSVAAAPTITVKDADGNSVPGSSVTTTADGCVVITSDPDSMLVYTTNGKTPAVKNGVVTVGEEYVGPIALADLGTGVRTIKAISINAYGEVSKTTTQKVKVTESTRPVAVAITAPIKMVAGKSVTLAASVLPAAVKQSVTWTLVTPMDGVSLNAKTGKLTTKATVNGQVTVQAASTVDASVCSTAVIQIAPTAPVASISMAKTMKLNVYSDGWGMESQLYPTFLDKAKNELQDVACTFTSSNTKVATVSPWGVVNAVAKGTATITCKALDGSGKSATCKVTVNPGVESITLSGQSTIAPGASATYKAAVTGKGTVTYEVKNAPEGVTLTKNKIKVASSVPVGTTFTLIATADDGCSYTYDFKQITVASKAKTMTMTFDLDFYKEMVGELPEGMTFEDMAPMLEPPEYKLDKKGNVTNLTLYSSDCLGYGFYAYLMPTGENVTWTSSNPDVVGVYDGYIYGQSAGTAKVTCKLNDGSNLSKTVTVKVVTPVSSSTVVPVNPEVMDDVNFLYFGTSVKHKVVLGDAAGKPTSTAYTWDFIMTDGAGNDLTEEFKANGWASVDKNGVASLSAKYEQIWLRQPYSLYMDVIAVPKYGPHADECISAMYYCAAGPTTIYWADEDEEGIFLIKDDNVDITLHPFDYEEGFDWYGLYVVNYDGFYQYFSCESSDPEIASATMQFDSDARLYYVQVVACGLKTGDCVITVSTADNLHLTKTLTVHVE